MRIYLNLPTASIRPYNNNVQSTKDLPDICANMTQLLTTLAITTFNNKIKIALLILIWTLIWRNGGCAADDNNNNNNGNDYKEQHMEYAQDNAQDTGENNDYNFTSSNDRNNASSMQLSWFMGSAELEDTLWHNGVYAKQVAKDQFAVINATLHMDRIDTQFNGSNDKSEVAADTVADVAFNNVAADSASNNGHEPTKKATTTPAAITATTTAIAMQTTTISLAEVIMKAAVTTVTPARMQTAEKAAKVSGEQETTIADMSKNQQIKMTVDAAPTTDAPTNVYAITKATTTTSEATRDNVAATACEATSSDAATTKANDDAAEAVGAAEDDTMQLKVTATTEVITTRTEKEETTELAAATIAPTVRETTTSEAMKNNESTGETQMTTIKVATSEVAAAEAVSADENERTTSATTTTKVITNTSVERINEQQNMALCSLKDLEDVKANSANFNNNATTADTSVARTTTTALLRTTREAVATTTAEEVVEERDADTETKTETEPDADDAFTTTARTEVIDDATATATPTAPNKIADAKEPKNAEANQADTPWLDVTAALQQQLIYEFAIKYKQIPRVTLLTCRWQSDDASDGPADAEQTLHFNMYTKEILKRFYNAGAEATKTNTAAEANQQSESKTAKGSKDATVKDKKAEDGKVPKVTKTVPPTTTETATPNEPITTTSKVTATATPKNTTTATDATTPRTAKTTLPATSGNDNTTGNMPPNQQTDNGTGKLSKAGNDDAATTDHQPLPTPTWAISIKVVQIDQLINKPRRTNNNNNLNIQRAGGGAGAYARAVGGAGAGNSAGAGAGGRNAYTSANWLEQVLRSDVRRQIVVLNLACGAASRRLLEMASNKALFNSSYHWLLIEDYAFNRQTGIDDSDSDGDGESNGNNNIIMSSGKKNNERVVNEHDRSSSITNTASTSRSTNERPARQQPSKTGSTVASDAVVATDVAGNEDDVELIEKFLEKINININTELILAKRHTARIRDIDDVGKDDAEVNAAADDDDDDDDNVADAVADGIGDRNNDDADNVAARSTNTNSSNNALQRRDYYALYDIWSPGLQYGGELNISEIGYFTLDDGLQIGDWYRQSTTITRRFDMKLARIRCLIVITNKNRTDTLEHYLTTHYDTHLDSMNRFNFALLSHVRDLFNFSFVLAKTATWGYLKNGKFDGMIGALVRKQADIGGSPIFFRIERAKVIDYTSRTWVARPCFIFRHPRSTKKDRIVFLQPFSNDVWIILAICGMFTILMLWLLTTLERRMDSNEGLNSMTGGQRKRSITIVEENVATCHSSSVDSEHSIATGSANSTSVIATRAPEQPNRKHQKKPKRKQKREPGKQIRRSLLRCGNALCGQTGDDVAQQRVGLFLESVLFYIGSICQQGLAFSTSFFSGRCIVVTSLLFAFSIYQFYSASIVGTLLMEKPKTIRTLRDLIHSSLEIGIEDIVYNRDYFLRTKDPDAIELYAKKVTSVPMTGETFAETPVENAPAAAAAAPPPMPVSPALPPGVEMTAAQKAKSYRDILHSHETGAHAKTNEASNWYDPEFGLNKIRKGRFAFHVDVATAYKIIADTFTEKEICDLTEIQLFPPQKMVNIVQKGSPLRKIITYGLRRVTEVGLMDYQRKVWHSPKPRCVKQIHTDDLRVDMQTFTSALLVLIFGYAVSLLSLGFEIMHHKLWQRYGDGVE